MTLEYARPAEQAKPPKFALHWSAIVPATIAGVGILLFGQVRPDAAQPIAYKMGQLVTVTLLPLLIAWAVWRFTGRSRLVATLVFSALSLFMCLGNVAARSRMTVAQAQALVAPVMLDLTTKQQAFNSAVNAFSDSGGLDVASIVSADDLEKRITLLATTVRAADDQYAASSGLRAKLQGVLAGMSKSERDVAVNGLMKSAQGDVATELHQVEVRLVKAYADQLQLLKSTFGQWRVPKGSDTPTFIEPTATAKYETIIAERTAALSALDVSMKQIKNGAAATAP